MSIDLREGVKETKSIMDDLGIEGEIIQHDESGSSTEDASEALGVPKYKILKTLLFVSEKDNYVGAIVTGDAKVDVDKLESLSKTETLELAGRETVREITGFEVGGVPPFALADRCPSYVDNQVLAQDFVVGAAGTEYAGVKFDPEELREIEVTVADIT